MDVFLVFNELCLLRRRQVGPDVNRYLAHDWMIHFAEILNHARRYGVHVLKVRDGFADLELVSDYTIRDWLADRQVDREIRRRVRSAATALNRLSEEAAGELRAAEEKRLTLEFKYDAVVAQGLGDAILLESIAMSLETDECWHPPEIPVNVEELVEDGDTLEIVSTTVQVKHVCRREHLDLHRNWVQNERYATGVQNGIHVLSKLDDWFPSLIFIDNARMQIQEMTAGTPQLRQMVIKLFELQNYCFNWTSGDFDPSLLASKASPESQSVANDTRLRKLREFLLPDGSEGYFGWHVRLTPDAWRLHFLPNPLTRTIYVGYIGRHLPTRTHRT